MCVERKAAMKRCALCHGRLDWAPASVIYGTVVGGFMFGFVRLVAKAFMRSGETRPPNGAGTLSSLVAIRRTDWLAPLHR